MLCQPMCSSSSPLDEIPRSQFGKFTCQRLFEISNPLILQTFVTSHVKWQVVQACGKQDGRSAIAPRIAHLKKDIGVAVADFSDNDRCCLDDFFDRLNDIAREGRMVDALAQVTRIVYWRLDAIVEDVI